jgi:hypothetical protein
MLAYFSFFPYWLKKIKIKFIFFLAGKYQANFTHKDTKKVTLHFRFNLIQTNIEGDLHYLLLL